MPNSQTATLRSRSEQELRNELEETHQALFNLRFQVATGQLADVSQMKKTRRQIARLKTLLREHELAAQAEG
jgi:large subunit ribosomal protein L29